MQIKPPYANPPINEVALSVQFATLENYKQAYTGELWNALGRSDFPDCQDVHPLAKLSPHPRFELALVEDLPLPRVWFMHADGHGLVQFQNDRFCYNWRKNNGTGDDYQRYESIKPRFVQYYSTLVEFLKTKEITEPKLEILQLNYVNLVPMSEIGGLAKLSDYFTVIGGGNPGLPEIGQLQSTWRFKIDDIAAWIDVSFTLAKRRDTGEDCLKFDLVCTGNSPSSRLDDKSLSWFDNSRMWIRNVFDGIITDKAKKVWNKK